MAVITTPVDGFNGTVAGVTFTDGVGETTDESALAYFERQGYGSESVNADKPFSQLNKGELEAVALEEGIDITTATTKDEIRAAIKAVRDSK